MLPLKPAAAEAQGSFRVNSAGEDARTRWYTPCTCPWVCLSDFGNSKKHPERCSQHHYHKRQKLETANQEAEAKR